MKPPSISVLTTCYNRADFVAETIESVLAQSFEDFEYIIVDDGSTDGSFDVILDYAKRDSRIQAYQNESNLGDYPNRNKAASYANGKYLKYIDSDDILYGHALHLFYSYLEAHKTCVLALGKNNFPSQPMPIVLSSREAILAETQVGGVLGNAPGSVMIRRTAFEYVGGFSGTNLIGDYELWLKLAIQFPVILVPGHTGWDRRHVQQESNVDPVHYLEKRLSVLEHVLTNTKDEQHTEATQVLRLRLLRDKSDAVFSHLKRGSIGSAVSAKRQLGVSVRELAGSFRLRRPNRSGQIRLSDWLQKNICPNQKQENK